MRTAIRRRAAHSRAHAWRTGDGQLRRVLAVAAAIVVHALVVIGLRVSLRTPPAPAESVFEIDLIDAPAQLDAAEPPPPGVPQRLRHRSAAAGPPRHAADVAAPEPPPAADVPDVASLRLFDSSGNALVSSAPAAARSFVQAIEPAAALTSRRPLKVRPNHFASAWAGLDGKSLPERIWSHVLVTKEFTAPWGGRYGCGWVLIVVVCADIPDKPWQPPQTWKPATELDEY